MVEHTYKEISASFSLWGEYFDIDGLDNEEDFEARSLESRIAMLERAFGKECEECD